MRRLAAIATSILLLAGTVASQVKPQSDKSENPDIEQPIRIGTDLVQLDVVITDKNGRIVKGLTRDDFELFEKGKKQPLSFFEFIDASRETQSKDLAAAQQAVARGLAGKEVSRVFAFVVDDLTVRFEDLTYVREMLINFIDRQMQPSDLVAVIRTVGGKGLLQQFTTDKDLLRRAVAALLPIGHPLSKTEGAWGERATGSGRIDQGTQGGAGPTPTSGRARAAAEDAAADQGGSLGDSLGPSIEAMDVNSVADESDKALRAFMTLSTASFVIDSMQELPGRKSLVLISGGLPLLGAQSWGTASRVSNLLNMLTDNATRASVTIHTLDVRGLQVLTDFKVFDEVPIPVTTTVPTTLPELGPGTRRTSSGKNIDPRARSAAFMNLTTQPNKNAFEGLDAQEGLRALASATGGISVTNTNNFDKGMEKIIAASDGYYLLAYTPSDSKFDGDFRKIEIKVKADGLKVYSRRGYFAREEKSVAPASKQEQLLAAIKSPLARKDVDLDATLIYKATPPNRGAIGIHLAIDPRKLQFEQAADKKQISLDVAGFVFDEFGKLRGGFSETIKPDLSPEDYSKAEKGGLNYSANTELPSGVYQVRLVVRDSKTGALGTLSRYFEVPDLSKGRLAASSLMLGSVPASNPQPESVKWMSASRRVSRKNNLLYATSVYNAKLKGGKPQVTTQLTLTHNGRMIYQSPEEPLATSPTNPSQLMRVGQLKVSALPSGKYVMTLKIIDTLAEKRAQTLSRKMDFIVVD